MRQRTTTALRYTILTLALAASAACSRAIDMTEATDADSAVTDLSAELGGLEEMHGDHDHDHAVDSENHNDDSGVESLFNPFACRSASNSQLTTVNQGNNKLDLFVKGCLAATSNSKWCQQLTRPNPSSKSTFNCTYGSKQPHSLIHPDQNTWKHAYKAVQLIQRLEKQGISVAQIYNWWRPEPYNANVGGAAGRHPFGTSVDVRFSSMADMKKAHALLCRWRSEGQMRALGYYGSTGLHFGIGDTTANTWGKSCPQG